MMTPCICFKRLTKYGEICEASFDMSFPEAFDNDITDTFMLARQLAPNTLFRGRGMGGKKEDGGYVQHSTVVTPSVAHPNTYTHTYTHTRAAHTRTHIKIVLVLKYGRSSSASRACMCVHDFCVRTCVCVRVRALHCIY